MNDKVRRSDQPIIHRDVAARALSLLQEPDEIAFDLDAPETLDSTELGELISRAERRHQASSLFTRHPSGAQLQGRMLGPGWGIPSIGAVLLAFHAGAEIDARSLAGASGKPEDEVGQDLYHARRALTGSEAEACQHMRPLIGRYADSSLPRDAMIGLINHARACEQCRELAAEFRSLDERIHDAVEAAETILPATESSRLRVRRNPLLLWVPIIVVILVALIILAVISPGTSSSSEASSLFPDKADSEHRGWLILSSEHEVMAFDLESGERRRILEHPAHDWWNPRIISPGAELAVRWEEYTRVDQRIGALRAYDMNGERQFLHRWSGPRSRTFSGWLDNRTVIFTERGASRRSGDAPASPDSTSPSIVAANLESGEERVLYQGALDRVEPSPDGTFIAIVRPEEGPWPGKTIDILQFDDEAPSPIVATLERRYLSWTGRMVWAPDSSAIFVAAIPKDDDPTSPFVSSDSAPGAYDFERLQLVRIETTGDISEIQVDLEASGWIVPQAFSQDGRQLAVVTNESQDRDGDWRHAVLDLSTGQITRSDELVPGARWWKTEALWIPGEESFLTQRVASNRFQTEVDGIAPESLILNTLDESGAARSPTIVFQDTTTLNLRRGTGLGMLRAVPDEIMRFDDDHADERPRPQISTPLSQATSNQQLISQSSIASTGRYVLLRQHDSEAGSRDRLMHLQAWAGTDSDAPGTHDYAWLPRETAVVGVDPPDTELGQGSRIMFVATERFSPLHGFRIDPASVDEDVDRSYRLPIVSVDGARLGFFVRDYRAGSVQLWIDSWRHGAQQIDSWDYPDDTRLEPTLELIWTGQSSFAYSRVVDWVDGYPQRIELVRGVLHEDGDVELIAVHRFQAGGRDHGIDLADLAIAPGDQLVAIRLRHFTGDDPDRDSRDSIHINSTSDLSQSIELIRADPGEGLTWLGGDEWLVAGINGRLALLDSTGQEIDYLTETPAAFPVLTRPAEIWYQDLTGDGRIMRITFD